MKDIYTGTQYLSANPSWHEEDSAWKAQHIVKTLSRNGLKPKRIAEIGCGVGAVLRTVHHLLPFEQQCDGYDIAPDAIARAQQKATSSLQYYAIDLLAKDHPDYDLLLAIDVFEHVPDYLGFLGGCARRAEYKLYHIPLDVHVSSVMRGSFVRQTQGVGHLHYFTAESALESLQRTDHEIIDCAYTEGATELQGVHLSIKSLLAYLPRRTFGAVSKKIAARILGGYSLMVLCR